MPFDFLILIMYMLIIDQMAENFTDIHKLGFHPDLFNDQTTSDFIIEYPDVDNSIQKCWIHKIFLRCIPFFATFFSTQVGTPPGSYKVNSRLIVFRVIASLYGVPPAIITVEEFFEYYYEVQSWMIKDSDIEAFVANPIHFEPLLKANWRLLYTLFPDKVEEMFKYTEHFWNDVPADHPICSSAPISILARKFLLDEPTRFFEIIVKNLVKIHNSDLQQVWFMLLRVTKNMRIMSICQSCDRIVVIGDNWDEYFNKFASKLGKNASEGDIDLYVAGGSLRIRWIHILGPIQNVSLDSSVYISITRNCYNDFNDYFYLYNPKTTEHIKILIKTIHIYDQECVSFYEQLVHKITFTAEVIPVIDKTWWLVHIHQF